MRTSPLSSKAGFAILETIVALAVLAFALSGLMMLVQYGRARAEVHYHERYVMLRVDGELQRLKSMEARLDPADEILPVFFTIPQINRANAVEIPVTISFSRTLEWDLSLGYDVNFYAIVATAEWEEPKPLFTSSSTSGEKRVVQLREDYYFMRN